MADVSQITVNGETRDIKDTVARQGVLDNATAITLLNAAIPVGLILPFGGSTIPDGYLLCNGAAVSRTTYAELFAVIGTTFGTGDGSTTFNIPDLQNRAVMGASTSHLLGAKEADTTAVNGLSAQSTVTDPGHSHSYTQVTLTPPTGGTCVNGTILGTQQVGYTAQATTGISVSTTLSGDSETRPKNIRTNFIIRCSSVQLQA